MMATTLLRTGPMTIRQTEVHTFIVRIRRPPEKGTAAEGMEWHGEVVHVPSQRSASFRGLDKIDGIMLRLIDTEN